VPFQPQEFLMTADLELVSAIRKRELAADVLRNGGAIRLRVQGTSMLPTIWPGDMLTIKSADDASLVAGDIVLVGRAGEFIVHRLIDKGPSVNESRVITRGDAMPQADPASSIGEILGKVTAVQRGESTLPVPPKRSPLNRLCAFLLCECDILRNFALTMHARTVAPRCRIGVHLFNESLK